MKNRKGFTLVELLITIVIMGIITAIAIPLLRNARERNNEKQYTTYAESLKHATKLYLDSYEEDMFGKKDNGCAIVTFNQLKSRNYIKDIPIENITCDVSETYVKVVKINGKYGYSTSLVCGNKNADGTFSETARYPKEGISDSDVCGESASTIMRINAEPAPPQESNTYKRRNLDIKISSDTGINLNPVISYGFSLSSNTSEPQLIDGWKQLDLSVPALDKQINDIEAGYTIVVKSNKIITPDLISGDCYLIVKVEDLRDASGNIWNKDSDNHDSIIAFGGYRLDNTPPLFNDSAIISSNETYNTKIPKLDLKATDNISNDSQMRMCVSYEEDTCDKSLTAVKNYSPYDGTKELPEISSANDGSTHKIYVTIADAAGNYATQEFTYHVDLIYSLSYSLDSGSYGSSHPSTAAANKEFTLSNPTKSNLVTLEVASGINIDYTGSSFSSKSKSFAYTFSGWDITNMTNSQHFYGSTTATEVSSTGRKETTFKNLRNELGTVTFTAKWTPPDITLPKITKTGHTCVWTSEGIANKASGALYTPAYTNGATSRKFVAKCTANTYKIRYDNTGGYGTMSDTTCTYGQSCTIAKNTFWYTGWHVTGYNTKKNGTGTSYSSSGTATVTGLTTTNNGVVTLYAQWARNYLYFMINGNGGSWCAKSTSSWRKSQNTTYPWSKGYAENKNGSSWSITKGYQYDYIIGSAGQDGDYNPGFADYDNDDAICFSKSGYHAVSGKEWTDKNGHYINQRTMTYNTKDFSAWTPGCDLRYQSCTITVYVNWTRN